MTVEEFRESNLQLRRRSTGAVDYKVKLLRQIKDAGLPDPQPEFRFHPRRKFRADWKIGKTVLIEFEGGIFSRQPSHSSIKGILRDIEKGNEAVCLGYRIIRVTPATIKNGVALRYVKIALECERTANMRSDSKEHATWQR